MSAITGIANINGWTANLILLSCRDHFPLKKITHLAVLLIAFGYVSGFFYLPFGMETYVLIFGGIFSAIGVSFLAMKSILSKPKPTIQKELMRR
jgi:hypothetical protein